MAHIHFRDGFFIGVSPYEEKALWKKAGFKWSPKRERWVTDRLDIAKAVQGVPWTKTALAEVESRAQVQEASHELSYASDTTFEPSVPPGLHPLTGEPFSFYPYQKAGIEYALQRKDSLIADQPGLGKSPMGVGVFNDDPAARRALVIVPASLKEHWRREFETWKTKNVSVGIAETSVKVYEPDGVYKSGKRKGLPRHRLKEIISEVWPDTDVVIINYDILSRFAEQINDQVWDLVICDEAHALKSDDSGRTCFILGGSRDEPMVDAEGNILKTSTGKTKKKRVWYRAIEANRRLFLTGTPMMNKPLELWPMLRTCDPEGLGKDYEAYGYRYCDGFADTSKPSKKGFVLNFEGSSNLEELGEKLRSHFMIRRLKKDVLPELPPKFRQIVLLDSPEIREMVARESEIAEALKLFESMVCRQGETTRDRDDRVAREIAANASAMGFGEACDPDHPSSRHLNMDYAHAISGLEPPMISILFEEIAIVRRELGIAKVPAVTQWVKNFLDGGEKLLLFGYHTDVIKALAKALEKYCPATIWGGVHPRLRQPLVDRFQFDESCRVGVMQIDTAGVGYTMTRAKDVAWAEGDWVPTKLEQSFDRICRIGQKADKLMGFHLVANGSLDCRMAQRAYEKEVDISTALDS